MTPGRNIDEEHTWIRWAELTIVLTMATVIAANGWKGWAEPLLLAMCLLTILLVMGGKIHEVRSVHSPRDYNPRTSQKILGYGDASFLLTVAWAFAIVIAPLVYRVLKMSGAR